MSTRRTGLAAVLVTGTCFLASWLGSAPAGADDERPDLPVPYLFTAGITAELRSPGAAPPGSNDFSCKPSARHPNPVILLHGFAANMTDSWQTVSPLLANHGYCVFALTYGTYPRIDPTRQLGGLDLIENSSAQLKAFVARVLDATGAAKVDLVGWSEGGWLGRHYIQFDGGDSTVATYVGLAPANGPTNISQLVFAAARRSPLAALLTGLLRSGLQSLVPLVGQAADPAVAARLNAGGGTSPRVHYTNIASRYDELVPPSAAFVPTGLHVTNVVLQDGCPIDFTDHLTIATARRSMGFLLNALDPARAVPPPCVLALPGL
jgi:triacylglycerol lipase